MAFAAVFALPLAAAVEDGTETSSATAGQGVPVVGAGSRWRRCFAFFPPVVSATDARKLGIDASDAEARSKALLGTIGKTRRSRRSTYEPNLRTPLPPPNWTDPAFDDSSWLYTQAADFGIADQRIRYQDTLEHVRGARGSDCFVEEVGLVAQRARFLVTEPGKVSKLALSLVYRGGFVAYLNGKEIARGHLPKGRIAPTTPAEAYPYEVNLGPEVESGGKTSRQALQLMGAHRKVAAYSEYWAKKERCFGPIDIDPGALRKGVNVLAVELHRSEYPARCKKDGLGFAAVGLAECHLRAQTKEGAIVSAFSRPKALAVWNQQLWEPVWNTDFANPCEPARPIRIVGARNGVFSGKVVVGSAAAIEGLQAAVSELRTSEGASIPAKSVGVRYGATNPTQSEAEGFWKMGFSGVRFDALLDKAPEVVPPVPVKRAKVLSDCLGLPEAVTPAAVIPVWVTVRIPKGTAPGAYTGTLALRAKGAESVSVPIRLQVASWTLPDVKDYGSLLFIYQSPDTLETYYKVPRWSENHWRMIEASLKLMGEAGNIGLIFPLQAESAMGNAESFIPWIRKADGTYEYDFTRFDRYLETALKYHHPHRLKVIAVNVWGAENKPAKSKTRNEDGSITKTYGDNPRTQITVIDATTGEKSKMLMPLYGTPEAEALWRPVLLQVRQRLEAKGLADKMMLGMAWDVVPAPEHVRMFCNILGEIPWFRESHFDKRSIRYDANDPAKTVLVGCNSIVWGGRVPDPAAKRLHGWQYDPKHLVLNFNRAGTGSVVLNGFPQPWSFRMWMESTLTCGRNGNGRAGGDFFRAGYSRGSGNAGCMFGRYLRSQVGQTGLGNTCCDLFAPGSSGPVTTVRFENAREGNQESEARIVIEKALLDKAHPLPDDLAGECQALLDQRTHILRMWGIIEHKSGTQATTSIATSGWLDSNLRLFELADRAQRSRARP